jgi:hypothetical protein
MQLGESNVALLHTGRPMRTDTSGTAIASWILMHEPLPGGMVIGETQSNGSTFWESYESFSDWIADDLAGGVRQL